MREYLNFTVITGLALLTGAAWWGWKHATQFTDAAEGRVVEIHLSDGGTSRNRHYYPVVEFETARGERVRFRAGAGMPGGGDPDLPVGAAVPVVYDRADSEVAQIDSFLYRWAGPVGTAVSGVFLVGMGVWTVRRRERRERAPDRG
jgi:hypothetical protein